MSGPGGRHEDATGGSGQPGWRRRLLGGRDRLGWWLLPLFLMVGLGGAVLAGSLAVVYYAQQVTQLEEETRTAREELTGAAEDVRETADEALADIEEHADDVRDELGRTLPLADALEVGVVRLEVDAQLPTAGQDGADGQGGADGQDDADGPSDDAGTGAPAELHRAASGFVVVVEDGDAFLVTSLGLLDDPRSDERAPADVAVDVRLPAGTTTASVHSWDVAHDLLVLRAGISGVEPLPWRDAGAGLEPGDRVVAVGATPDLAPVRIGAEIGAVTDALIATTLPSLGLVDGGPVVDHDGRVVGVATASHAALGGDPVVVPVRRLCDELLRTCPD